MKDSMAQSFEIRVLHASEEGRGLYQRLGLAPTNEMGCMGGSAEGPKEGL
jgi:hypothetical protein